VRLEDVTLEQALQQITAANQLFYKVLNPKTIIIIPENAQKHAQYDDLVVRVFYISHADVSELAQVINTIMRIPTMPVPPTLLPNKTAIRSPSARPRQSSTSSNGSSVRTTSRARKS
jgi:hypothetical protein